MRGPHPLSLFLAMAMRVIGDDRPRMARFLEGLNRYQQAELPPPMPPMQPLLRIGGVSLNRVDPATAGAPRLLMVPSLINAPRVLDLAPGRSLLRHLAADGHDVLLLDWGPCGPAERRLGMGGLVSARLLPLLRRLDAAPLRIAGYCLGGTLALAAAQHLGQRCAALALIASPFHFDGFAPVARQRAAALYAELQPLAARLGALPVSLLNPLFWSLGEQAVIAKFERLATADDEQVRWFAAVEDWANSGAPLSPASARDLFLHGYAQDRIGRGRWRVGGAAIHPDHLQCPMLDAGATADRIVPPAARLRTPTARLTLDGGHVGMVVGSAARRQLWEPLSNWLKAH